MIHNAQGFKMMLAHAFLKKTFVMAVRDFVFDFKIKHTRTIIENGTGTKM